MKNKSKNGIKYLTIIYFFVIKFKYVRTRAVLIVRGMKNCAWGNNFSELETTRMRTCSKQ